MKLLLQNETNGILLYKILFGNDEYNKYVNIVMRKMPPNKVAGFRPGHAPLSLSGSNYTQALFQEIVVYMMKDIDQQFDTDINYLRYRDCEVKDMQQTKEAIVLSVEIYAVNLSQFKDVINTINIQKYNYVSEDGDAEALLQLLHKETLVVNDQNAVVVQTDIVYVSGYCTINDAQYQHIIPNTKFVINDKDDEAIKQALLGKKVSDKVVIKLQYEKNETFLNGKTVVYYLTINQIQKHKNIRTIDDIKLLHDHVMQEQLKKNNAGYVDENAGELHRNNVSHSLDHEESDIISSDINIIVQRQYKLIAHYVTKNKILIDDIAPALHIQLSDSQIETEMNNLAKIHQQNIPEDFRSLSERKLLIYIVLKAFASCYNITTKPHEIEQYKETLLSQLLGSARMMLANEQALKLGLMEEKAISLLFDRENIVIKNIDVSAAHLNNMLKQHCTYVL